MYYSTLYSTIVTLNTLIVTYIFRLVYNTLYSPGHFPDAVDLAMAFFVAITADEVVIIPAASISEMFLGGGTRVGVKVVRDVNPDFRMGCG